MKINNKYKILNHFTFENQHQREKVAIIHN